MNNRLFLKQLIQMIQLNKDKIKKLKYQDNQTFMNSISQA